MLVHRIKEFIKQLQACEKLNDFDKDFLQDLNTRFSNCRDDETLSSDTIKCIEQIFLQRWKKIVDTKDDYTFDPSGNNALWIQFAKDLANQLNKSYLQILIPVAKNILEPNTLVLLTDCTDLRGLYLGDDGETLHRTISLVGRFQKKQSLSSYTNYNKYNLRSLSVHELFRTKAKAGDDLEIEIPDTGKKYKNFWDYLQREIIPAAKISGENPHHLLPSLLALVETYFIAYEKNNLQQFWKDLASWSSNLIDCSIDNVNHLYAQLIDVDGKQFYLIDLLTDFLLDKTVLNAKMIGIARWLVSIDPSFICKHEKLRDLYDELNVGKSFGVAQLKSCLLKLDTDGVGKLSAAIDALSLQLEGKEKIQSETVIAIRAIYRERWVKIAGQDKDYTRLQNGANGPWIRLAQLLCGGGYIEENYYQFLMPTITHDTDIVLRERLTTFPLSHFILSDDGKNLILLDNCLMRYRVSGTFYNCNSIPPKPLSEMELERVSHANKSFHKYAKLKSPDEGIRISVSTVMALKDLVDGSLYPQGLLYAQDYDQTQMANASKAYQIFFKFIHKLPAIERERLNAQCILFHGTNKSFSKVMSHIEQDGCIAVYGQYFAQLVMDYAPYLQFRSEIEDKVAINEMRAKSRLKMYRDYEQIDNQEAFRRAQILLFSLMTRPFSYFVMTGVSISAWTHSNMVVREAYDIYKLLMPIIQSRDIKKEAGFIYSQIMETIVKPALDNQSWSTWMTRYSDTQEWLGSIADQSLFKQKHNWYDPENMLATLLPFVLKDGAMRAALESFLDELVGIYISPPKNIEEQKVALNVKLFHTLNSMEDGFHTKVLQALEKSNKTVDQRSFQKLCGEMLIHRLALLGKSSSSCIGFFGGNTGNNNEIYWQIKNTLTDPESDYSSIQKLIEVLQSKLSSLLDFAKDKAAAQRMANYWKVMTGSLLTVPTSSFVLTCSQQAEKMGSAIISVSLSV